MSELRWFDTEGEQKRDVSALRFTVESSVGKLADLDLVSLVLSCAMSEDGVIFRTTDGLVVRLAERR